MASLTQVRDAAVALLREALPSIVRLEAFSGTLTMDDASMKRLPFGVSILVAAVAADNTAPPGTLDFDVTGEFGAIIVSKSKSTAEAREADSLAVAQQVSMALHGQTFALPDVGPAIVTTLEAVDAEEFAKNGICVWSVRWQQALTFSAGGTP